MNLIRTSILALFFLISHLSYAQESEKLVVVEKVDFLSSLAREPMIAEHPTGTLFLTGYANASKTPQLWKSLDKGKSWIKVNIGSMSEGADGNSDVDLAIDPDGIIYFISMKFSEIPKNTSNFDFSTLKGEHIVIGVSDDVGETWKWTYLSKNDYDDRPWVRIAPDKTAHVVWNDGKGINHATSRDKGQTWQRQPRISSKGGSSHFSIGQQGQLAVRVSPLSASGFQFDEGVDLIRLSLDHGQTWSDVKLPGKRDWYKELNKGTPRWVEPIGWDSMNRLYYLWSEGKQLKLGRSKDNGENWQVWEVEQSDQTVYYPYMVVLDNSIACTWISGFKQSLRHHAAIIELKKGEVKTIKSDPLELDIWSGPGNQLSTGGEYFPLIPLSDGGFAMATAIQNSKEKRLGFTWWRLSLKK